MKYAMCVKANIFNHANVNIKHAMERSEPALHFYMQTKTIISIDIGPILVKLVKPTRITISRSNNSESIRDIGEM